MDPVTVWLGQQAAGAVFALAKDILLQRLGLSPSPSAASTMKPLLDEYFQGLRARLDEDRIAKLRGAFSMLKDASKSVALQSQLFLAVRDFQEIVGIPQQGATGGRPNAELRCMAFVGLAASYIKLVPGERALIAAKMVEAVRADATTAKQWLGEELVREILARLPAPPSTLNSGQRPSPPLASQASILLLRRIDGPPQIKIGLHYGARIPYLVPEPSFRIHLDGKKIGTIAISEHSWMSGWMPGGEKSSPFAIQAGHHNLFLSVDWLKSPTTFLNVGRLPTPTLPFDIAPGETVTFLCQYAWKKPMIQLLKL